MARRSNSPWRWRVADAETSRRLDLLYEPGTFGDALKGAWAVIAADYLRQHAAAVAGRGRVEIYDPFAGSATYPLTPAAVERLTLLPEGPFRESQESYRAKQMLASTGLLAHRAAGGRLFLFDADPARRATWAAVEEAHVMAVESGEQALEKLAAGHAAELLADPPAGTAADGVSRLVLVDPYDFFDRWPLLAPLCVAAAREAAPGGALVLVYYYNRSPRGAAQFRAYQAMRRALSPGGPTATLFGRLPADRLLPRAWHEMALLGPRDLLAAIAPRLREHTLGAARAIAAAGAFDGEQETA